MNLEKGEQVIEIKRLTCNLRKTRQHVLEEIAQSSKRSSEKRQITDRELAVQRAPDDIGEGDVIGDGADRGEQASPTGAPRNFSIGIEEAAGECAVTLDQERIEPEYFDFLGGFRAGSRLSNINRSRVAQACANS